MSENQRIIVLDPSQGPTVSQAEKAKRLKKLDGITLGVVNNGKRNSYEFLQFLLEAIKKTSNLADVVWVDKSNHSLPITQSQLDQLRQCHAVISGIGD